MNTEALSLQELREFDPRAPVRDGESDFCCPLCGQEKPRDAAHRCLSLNVRSGLWECHRCQAKGKLRERWEDRRPLSYQERRRAALTRAFSLPPPEPERPADPSWREHLRGLQPLAGTPGETYLAGRGIPCAHAAGSRFSPSWYGRPAVVFPFRNRHEVLVAAQGRCVDGQEPGKLSAGPISAGAFLTPGALQADPLAIVEAPIDALSLALVGLPALALAGTGSKPFLPHVCAFHRVLLATDADEAGDRAATELATVLTPLGARCERLRPEGGKDWNELLVRVGADALRAGLAAAGVLPSEEPDRCRRCGAEATYYLPDGTPVCNLHAAGEESNW